MRDQAAIVQEAVDLTAIGSEIDGLLAQIREGDAAIHRAKQIVDDWRVKAGQRFAEVRKTIPLSGPRAKRWGEFVEARGVSLDTAANYMKLAEYAAANPDAVISGKTVGDVYKELKIGATSGAKAGVSPKYFGETLPPANYALDTTAPPKNEEPKADPASKAQPVDLNTCNRADLWQRFLKGEMTGPEGLARKRTWTLAHQESDARIRQEYSAACKAARAGGKTVPPFPPMPGYWLTAGASNDPVQAAAKALSAAEALGREDASRKSPRMIGEVVQRLRQGSHLIPSGQDQAVYRAYCEARTAAVSRAAVEDTKTMPLPFEAAPPPAPAPRPFVPVMAPESEADADADADADDDDDADDFDADDDRDLTPADDDREDEDELREAADELEGERNRLAAELTRVRAESESQLAALVEARRERDEAQRDSELAAKAHAQALKTMEGMERELTELRDGWELAARERVAAGELRAEIAGLRAKLEAAEVRLTERGQQLHQQRQDGAELLRRAQRAEAELCALRELKAAVDDVDGAAPARVVVRPLAEVLTPERRALRWQPRQMPPPLALSWAGWGATCRRAPGDVPPGREDDVEWLIAAELEAHDLDPDDLTPEELAQAQGGLRGVLDGTRSFGPQELWPVSHGEPVPAAPAPAPWEPRSCGGAKAVHAVTPKDSDGNPPALCGQRPAYSSKGWTPRPGCALTCKGCIAATNEEAK